MGTERRGAGLALALLLAAGCASPVRAPVEPPSGGAFSYYWAPLSTHFEATPVGSKIGTTDLYHIEFPLYYVARVPLASFADAGVASAAARGGIQKVYYADYEVLNVLGVFTRIRVRVSGD